MKIFYILLIFILCHTGLNAQLAYLDSIVVKENNNSEYKTQFSYNDAGVCDTIKSFEINNMGVAELTDFSSYNHNDNNSISTITFFETSMFVTVNLDFSYFGEDSTIVEFQTYDGDMIDSDNKIVQIFDENGDISLKYSKFSNGDEEVQILKEYYFFNEGQLDSTSSYFVENDTKEESLYIKSKYSYVDGNLTSIMEFLDLGTGDLAPYSMKEFKYYVDGIPTVTLTSSLSFSSFELELDSKDSTVFVDGLYSEYYETVYYTNIVDAYLTKYNYIENENEVYSMTYLNNAFSIFNTSFGEDEFLPYRLSGTANGKNMILDNIEYLYSDGSTNDYELDETEYYYYSDGEGSVNTDNHINAETTIYPNPSQNYLQVKEAEDYNNFIIFDAEGKVINGGKLSGQVDVSGLDSGTYSIMFRSQNGDKTALSRFVKIK